MVETVLFTYIYSLHIEKDICDCRNVSIKLPCFYVWPLSGDLFIFFGKRFLFLFLFFVLSVLRYFHFHMVSFIPYLANFLNVCTIFPDTSSLLISKVMLCYFFYCKKIQVSLIGGNKVGRPEVLFRTLTEISVSDRPFL